MSMSKHKPYSVFSSTSMKRLADESEKPTKKSIAYFFCGGNLHTLYKLA